MLITLVLVILLAVPITASAQTQVYTHDSTFPFIIITSDTVKSLPPFSEEEFYKTSSGIIFKVNKTDIPSTDPFMQLYRDSVQPFINRSRLQLRKVYIRGAASPEGPYANNRRLGKGRSKVLLDELRKDLFHQYVKVDEDVSCITEDYGFLCQLMKEANDPDYQLVQNIFNECNGDEPCCKAKLMKAQKGKLWARLLKQYFPRLRAARLILWFSEPDMEHATIKQQIRQTGSVAIFDEPDEEVEQLVDSVEKEPIPQLSIVFPPEQQRRHLIAIRTNLIHDLLYIPQAGGWVSSPNVQLEYYPLDGHYTYNVGMTWGTHRNYNTHKFFQMRDFQIETRRYFKGGGRFLGTYLGAFIEGNVYGIGLGKKDGWEGEGGGAGLSLGHTMALNKRKSLRLEFMIAGGLYRTYHDPYVYGNPVTGKENGKYYYNYLGAASKFRKRNHSMTWLGPLNLGIQLTYDIIYRPRKDYLWRHTPSK